MRVWGYKGVGLKCWSADDNRWLLMRVFCLWNGLRRGRAYRSVITWGFWFAYSPYHKTQQPHREGRWRHLVWKYQGGLPIWGFIYETDEVHPLSGLGSQQRQQGKTIRFFLNGKGFPLQNYCVFKIIWNLIKIINYWMSAICVFLFSLFR